MSRKEIVRSLRESIEEQVEPLVCFAFVYLGVLCWGLLPSSLLAVISSLGMAGIAISPFAAFPIAIIVYANRAGRRWRNSSRAAFSHRALHAMSDGIRWFCWLRER
jgi:hypothetical protein